MTTQMVFKCNLCGDIFQSPNGGISLLERKNDPKEYLFYSIEKPKKSGTDRHLCWKCVKMFISGLQKFPYLSLCTLQDVQEEINKGFFRCL